MSIFTPDAWEGVGVVTIVILVAIASLLALARGWIVPGKYHDQLMQTKDAVIDTHVETIRELTSANQLFAESEAKKAAQDNLTGQVAEQVRQLMESQSGGA